MATSVNQPQASPLLDLPPELRNTIYSYALVEPKPEFVHIFCVARWRRANGLGESNHPFHWRPPGLLQTCGQLRKEASAMYYTSNHFIAVYDVESRVVGLQKWLGALEQENVRSLMYVGVDVPNFNTSWTSVRVDANSVQMLTTRTIDLMRELFGFWKDLQGTDLALAIECSRCSYRSQNQILRILKPTSRTTMNLRG